jgi:hypothetical protein
MTQDALRLLQGILSLLKFIDFVTGPMGLALALWVWLSLTLPYDTALGLWLATLVPLLMAHQEAAQK